MASLYGEAEEAGNLLLSEVLINFGELFKMCVESKVQQSKSIESKPVEVPAKQCAQRRRRPKTADKEVPAKKSKQQSPAKLVTATISPDQVGDDYSDALIEELDDDLDEE